MEEVDKLFLTLNYWWSKSKQQCSRESSPFFTFVWSYHFVSFQSMSLPALIYLVRRNCKTPFHELYSRTIQWSIPIILKVSFPKSYWNLISESILIEYADDRSLGWHQRLHFPRYYPPYWTFISYLIGLKQRAIFISFRF